MPIDGEDNHAAAKVSDGHEWHELLGNARDGFHAAENNERHGDGDHERDSPIGNAREARLDDAGDSRRLHRGARADGGDNGEGGKRYGAELGPPGHAAIGAFKRALPCVHRAAEHFALVIFHAVFDRREYLAVFGRDAEYAGEPHPEHGARAASDNRGGNADDRSRADGARERRDERAKLAYVAFGVFVFGEGQFDGCRQLALNEPCANGQEDMRAQEQANHRRAPYDSIDLSESINYCIHEDA